MDLFLGDSRFVGFLFFVRFYIHLFLLTLVAWVFLWPQTSLAHGDGVEWSKPWALSVKSMRRDRRVVRFGGATTPGALIRVVNNKVRVHAPRGAYWVNIPKKYRTQFPVRVDDLGEFSFELYLPVEGVHIPVEIFTKGRWRRLDPIRLDSQQEADIFQEEKQSFQDLGDMESSTTLTDGGGGYSANEDKGQYVLNPTEDAPLAIWLGLGVGSVVHKTRTPKAHIDFSNSGLSLPSFQMGVDWQWTPQIQWFFSLRNTTTSFEISESGVRGNEFKWTELQLGGLYFFSPKGKKQQWASPKGKKQQWASLRGETQQWKNHWALDFWFSPTMAPSFWGSLGSGV